MTEMAIPYSLGAVITGGQTASVSGELDVGAIDVLRADVAKDAGTAELDLTAEDIATIEFVSIKSDNYADLAFTIDGGSPIALDGPLMLVGAGQVGLLGATLATIEFTNSDTVTAANVEVCIGRSGAVPPL